MMNSKSAIFLFSKHIGLFVHIKRQVMVQINYLGFSSNILSTQTFSIFQLSRRIESKMVVCWRMETKLELEVNKTENCL